MAKPQIITIAAGAGITGRQPAQQIPLGVSGVVTLVNQSSTLSLTLCTNDQFSTGTTWPLPPNTSAPQTDVDNLWVQNPNLYPVNVLVMEGIIPYSLTTANGFSPTGTQDIYLGGRSGVGSYTTTINLDVSWRSIWVAVQWTSAATTTISLVGVQSGISYQAFSPPYFILASNQLYRFPMLVGIDTQVTLTITSSANFNANYGADVTPVDIFSYSTIYQVLGFQFNTSSVLTYSAYSTASLAGYSFSSVPVTASYISAKINGNGQANGAWTAQVLPITPIAMAANNGIFVIVASTSTTGYYSTDGHTWTSMTIPISSTLVNMFPGGNNDIYLCTMAATTNTIYRTTDGHTWSAAQTLPSLLNWSILGTGANGVSMIATATGVIAYTTNNGTTWLTGGSSGMQASTIVNVLYHKGSNNFVAFPSNGLTAIGFNSPTNLNNPWTAGTPLLGNCGQGNMSSFGTAMGELVYGDTTGGVNYTPDPSTAFTLVTTTIGNSNTYIVQTGGTYIQVSRPAATANYYSLDGKTWVSHGVFTVSTACAYVAATNGIFVVVGAGTASQWSTVPLGDTVTVNIIGQLSGITYGNQTITQGACTNYYFPVSPAIDTAYYLVNAIPNAHIGWFVPDATGDINVANGYQTTVAPPPNVNVIEITYQIFTAQAAQAATVVDALGNVIGTISLSTTPGVYTAHISLATNTSTDINVYGLGAGVLFKVYTVLAHN